MTTPELLTVDPGHADLALAAVDLAPFVVEAVHDTYRPQIAELLEPLDRQQLVALVVVLAAAFNPDHPFLSAVDWANAEPPGRPVEPCGTHSAFVRHTAAGERIDPLCTRAERDYQHARHLRRTGKAQT